MPNIFFSFVNKENKLSKPIAVPFHPSFSAAGAKIHKLSIISHTFVPDFHFISTNYYISSPLLHIPA